MIDSEEYVGDVEMSFNLDALTVDDFDTPAEFEAFKAARIVWMHSHRCSRCDEL